MTDKIGPDFLNKLDLERIYEKQKSDIAKGKKVEDGGFETVLKGFINEVNDLQLNSHDKMQKLASGEIQNIHEVMIAATEADTSFKIMMDMRNRLMKAYDEMLKMGGS